jgi:hypothetical protein
MKFRYFIREQYRFLSSEEIREKAGIWRYGEQGLEFKWVMEKYWVISVAKNIRGLMEGETDRPIIEIPECEVALFL